MAHRLTLVMLLVVVSLWSRSARNATAQTATYHDPFAYCAAVGTIDAPDARYTGPAVPDVIARGLREATQATPDTPLDQFITGGFWRCMDNQVYACAVGANLPCQSQADTSQIPTPAMTQYCQANPDGSIPGFVTGSATMYTWDCRNGTATPGRSVWQVDTQGFIANIWYAITPEGDAEPQILPTTGGALSFATETRALLALGIGAALLGLTLRRRVLQSSVEP